MSTVLVLPSLKISGGTHQALRLLADAHQADALTLSMWDSPNPIENSGPVEYLSSWKPKAWRALLDLPPLMYRFVKWLNRFKSRANAKFIFTHYATLPLALFVPRQARFFFVQGVEWRFTNNPLLSALLKKVILTIYKSGHVITANPFLSGQMRESGLHIACEMPIWAAPLFGAGMLTADSRDRSIDYAMVLRKGEIKRLDLYREFISQARNLGRKMAIITPEDDVARELSAAGEVHLRPSAEDMQRVYGRSRCFIHLSDHEGFGLPPLEAMGSGCVPLCRDSGGIRAFLHAGSLSALILPKTLSSADFFSAAEKLLHDTQTWESLSHEVRLAFDSGVTTSSAARRGLSDLLS